MFRYLLYRCSEIKCVWPVTSTMPQQTACASTVRSNALSFGGLRSDVLDKIGRWAALTPRTFGWLPIWLPNSPCLYRVVAKRQFTFNGG